MKRNLKLSILLFLSVIFFLVGFVLLKKGFNNYVQDIVYYDESGLIDYNVYLLENNYFDAPFLGEDKAYITSLIDYIDVDFSYNLDFNDKRSGRYVYYIKGIISANASNTDKDYWQKTYDLLEKQEITYDDVNKIEFKENLKINYQEYNNLLLQFKEDYKLSMDGSFKVVLYVENYIDSVVEEGSVLKNTSITNLEIPLTKSTIEVPIAVSEIESNDFVAGELVYQDSISYLFYKVFAILLLILGFILSSYVVVKFIRGFEKISLYNKNLRKILKTYDGIIVNISKLPNFSSYNVIDVNSFSELLDAHSEIRQPISYFEEKKCAIFVLINGDIIWKYVLKDLEYEKK